MQLRELIGSKRDRKGPVNPPRPNIISDDGEIHPKKIFTMLRLSSPNMSNLDCEIAKEKDTSDASIVVINKGN